MNRSTLSQALVRAAAVALLYGLVGVLVAGGVARKPGTRLLGDTSSDAAGVARGLWVADREHRNPFTLTHDDYMGAPEGVPQAPTINLLEPVQPLSVWAMSRIVGRVGAINLFLLIALMVTAFSAFLLSTWVFGTGLVGAAATSFAVTFNPWVIEQAVAGHLAFAVLGPVLGLIGALAYVDARRSIRAGALVGVGLGASFLTAAYIGLLAVGIAFAGSLVILARTRGLADRLWLASLASVALLVTLVFLLPGLVGYSLHHTATARIAGHTGSGGEAIGVWPQQYLNPAPLLAILGRFHVGTGSLAFGAAESIVFFGYSTLVLAIIALLLWRRGAYANRSPLTRAAIPICAAAAALALLVAVPPHVVVAGRSLALPSALIVHVTSYYRIYARFGLVVGLCAALLAGLAIDYAWRAKRALGAALALLVAVELLPAILPTWSTAARPIDRWLRNHPSGIVAVYPQPTDSEVASRLALTYLALQPNNGDPSYTLISGGTGGTREAAIRILSRYLNDPATPGILAAEHVRYVLVDTAAFAAERTTAPTPDPGAFASVGQIGAVRILALKRRVAPADLDTLLEQNAATIGLVEGLVPPTVHYQGFTKPDRNGWRTFGNGATIEIQRTDPNVRRVLLVVHLRSTAGAATFGLVDANGATVAGATVPPQDTQLSLGPFALDSGTTRFVVRLDPSSARLQLGSVLAQPWADFSVSLAR